jgi:hypothetical protein
MIRALAVVVTLGAWVGLGFARVAWIVDDLLRGGRR